MLIINHDHKHHHHHSSWSSFILIITNHHHWLSSVILTISRHQHTTSHTFISRVSNSIHYRVLINLFIGSNDLEVTVWIWRVSLISNAIATYASIDYATSSLMTDYYWLHTINITLQCLFWILFPLCLVKTPGMSNQHSTCRICECGILWRLVSLTRRQ